MEFRVTAEIAARAEWSRWVEEEGRRIAASPDYPRDAVGEWMVGNLADGRQEIRLWITAAGFSAQLYYGVNADGNGLTLFARTRFGKGVMGERGTDAGTPGGGGP